jgi:hypothetical protein
MHENYADGKYVVITDVVLGNVAGENATSERRATATLYALRMVMKTAFGKSNPMLQYEDEVSRLVKALGKSRKATKAKYTNPVDLQCIWQHYIIRSIKMEKQTVKARYNERRGKALFLLRHDRVSRSDDEYKWDPRDLRYLRCYDKAGRLIVNKPLQLALKQVVVEDGVCEVNYLDPKDPRKKGLWSDVVVHRPLRPEVVWTANFDHFERAEDVEAVCAVRALEDLVCDMDALGLLGKWNGVCYEPTEKSVPEGHFWASKTAKVVGTARAKPLLPQSLSSIVKKLVKDTGVGEMGSTDEGNAWGEDGGANEPGVKLAGHFLRGHAGSVAFVLAETHGAAWEASEGIDRARHTLNSFFTSYMRGVVERIRRAFDNAPNKAELRFEEAARG